MESKLPMNNAMTVTMWLEIAASNVALNLPVQFADPLMASVILQNIALALLRLVLSIPNPHPVQFAEALQTHATSPNIALETLVLARKTLRDLTD